MKVYIVAGEPSGDLLASSLMKAIREKRSDVTFYGVGGESMQSLGFKSLFNISEISVMGFFEVVPRLPLILKRLRQVTREIEQINPDVIVTVDSWGFVSSLLGRLKKKNIAIPKVHYVAPQVWAWKKGRAKSVAKLTNRLMTLLPYEPAYFQKFGLKSDFVGHPVIESTLNLQYNESEFKQKYNIPQNVKVLTALPGSRLSEAKKLIPRFIDTVNIIKKTYPDVFLLIPTVETVAKFTDTSFKASGLRYQMIYGREERYRAFKTSIVAIAASGTVSLELAACGTPHTISYTFNALTNFLARIFVKIKYANLINILAGREIVPEFLLKNCRAELIAHKTLELINNPEVREEQINGYTESLDKLNIPNKLPSERAAEIVIEEAESNC